MVVAEGKTSSLSPTMTNVSHTVHHLTFGQKDRLIIQAFTRTEVGGSILPSSLTQALQPLNEKNFITKELHSAPQHYIKVVSSSYKIQTGFSFPFGKKTHTFTTHQMSTQNRIRNFHKDAIPEAKFTYTFEPIHIVITNERQSIYSFLTKICAITGGTFSILSLTNLMLNGLLFSFITPRSPLPMTSK